MLPKVEEGLYEVLSHMKTRHRWLRLVPKRWAIKVIYECFLMGFLYGRGKRSTTIEEIKDRIRKLKEQSGSDYVQ